MTPKNPILARTMDASGKATAPITLRDLFAACCAAGIISNQSLREDINRHVPVKEEDAIAHYAYEYADALLECREATDAD